MVLPAWEFSANDLLRDAPAADRGLSDCSTGVELNERGLG
jgi:hypothetical protein